MVFKVIFFHLYFSFPEGNPYTSKFWLILGKDSCNIRVISFTTSDRALIKGIEGMAQDIAFAFILAPVLLACIDSIGDVYVYTVEENQLNALTCCLMVHIKEVRVYIRFFCIAYEYNLPFIISS